MSFTAFNAISQLPYHNPLENFISHALKGYSGMQHAKYLPEQIQADIFSKEIGPVAQLAASPNFRGFNPTIQKMIAQRVGSYLSGQHGGHSMNVDENIPGYPSNEDIFGRLSKYAPESFGEGKKLDVAKSNIGNVGRQWALPDFITNIFGGPGPSSSKSHLEQAKKDGIQNLELRGYSHQDAVDIMQQRPGENANTYVYRTRPYFVNKGSQETQKEPIVKGVEDKIKRDRREMAEANTLAKRFKTTPEMILQAASEGITHYSQLQKYINEHKSKGM